MADLERDDLADAQPSGVGREEEHAVATMGGVGEEPGHLLAAEHLGLLVRGARRRDPEGEARAPEGDVVEEAQAGHHRRHALRREVADLPEVDQVRLDLWDRQSVRRAAVVPRQVGDKPEVILPRARADPRTASACSTFVRRMPIVTSLGRS